MNTDQREQQTSQTSQEHLLTLARALIGGNRVHEDNEHPLQPGPWDSLTRMALARNRAFDPHPPFLVAFNGSFSFGDEVALNPQPLPPRYAFLVSVVKAVVNRAELLQDIADAAPREGQLQGIIIVSGLTGRFSEDWCGSDFRMNWPFPGPKPQWFASELDGIDLVVIGAQFEQAANETYSPDLRQNLADASAKFIEAGLSRM